MLALAPSPDENTRKRRWAAGDLTGSSPEAHVFVAPKRRYAEPRRPVNFDSWVAHLRARYPAMEDQEIAAALQECDNDVEATIRRLDELSLAAAARAGEPGSLPPLVDAPAGNAPAPQAAPAQPPDGGDRPAAADEWVDVVVRELSASTDLVDARRRASAVLGAFETAVRGDVQSLRGALEAAQRDTTLLKRAVAIQQQRHHESAAAAQQEADSLRAALAQQQEQLHAAQMSAYAMSVHLRQAMDGHPKGPSGSGPDWVA